MICLYCTTAPLKGIHVTPTPPCHIIFFFVKGFSKEASASLLAPFRWPWVVSLWRGLASTLPYQCVATSLVVKGWCPLATKTEGKN